MAPIPSVRIHRLSDLEFLGSVTPEAELDITALAFSSDGTRLAVTSSEPELSLSIYEWKQGDLILTTSLPLGSTATQVSFHPHNANLICTTGNGAPLEWRLEKLWGTYEVSHSAIEVPEGLGASTCHSWFPGGLYIGFNTGQILAVDVQPSPPAQPQGPSFSPPGSAPLGAVRSVSKKEVAMATLGLGAAYDSPRLGIKRPSTFIAATGSPESPVTAISVSRDHVAVAAGSEPVVRWFNHAFPPSHIRNDGISPTSFKSHTVQSFGSSEYSSVIGISLGGDEFDVAAVGLSDGSIRLFGASNKGGAAGASVEEIAVEAHAGAIHGLATHPSGPGRILSCGADGVLRVWEVMGAQYEQHRTGSTTQVKGASSHHHIPTIAPRCIDRRTFSSVQTALAASSSHLLAALGSEGGVVRIISLAEGGPRPLSVVFRRRLHSSAVVSLAFSPDGKWLASAGKDGAVSFISLNEGATSALLIGYITCPDPIIGLVWPVVTDGDDCVLVTLASGAVLSATVPEVLSKARRSSHHAGMQLSKDVSVKVVKIETALVCAAGLAAGQRYGELVGLGADKMLHRIPLPMEGQAWGGLKGRVSKSSIRAAAHQGALGGVAVSGPNALVVATASVDGHVSCHVASSLDPIGSTKNTGLGSVHDATLGGASCVAMDLSGRWLISAGQDGSMFALEALLPPALCPPPAATAPLSVVPKLDLDAFDDPSEPTEADYHRKRVPSDASHAHSDNSYGLSTSTSGGGGVTGAKLEALRERLRGCILRNDAADDLEKLSKTDLIVDKALASELGSLADARVASVREELKKEHLKLELVAHRVKKGCYDEMSGQKGSALTSMKGGVEVRNFPLVAPIPKALQKVSMLRQVEQIEEEERKVAAARESAELFASGAALNSEPSMLNSLASNQELAQAAEDAEAYPLAYNDLELHGHLRKSAQVVFFKQRLYDVKTSFNAEFDTVVKLKRSEADRILDLNARIDETLKDLAKIGGSATEVEKFVAPFPEDMKRVLEVKDSEVPVEKVSSSMEGKMGEEDGGKGRVGGRDAATLTDRALKQMMGGTLASKVEEADPYAIERPAWMDGNPKLFGEDQLRALREFQAKERALNEDRAKKISSLESELRSLKASVEDAASKFDENIQGLQAKKIKALSEVEALEVRIIALSSSIDQCQRTGDAAEREEFISMTTHSDAKAKVVADLTERRALLNEAELKATEIAGEERLLDKNFKREFADTEDLYSKLLQLYRYREGDALPTPRHGHRNEGFTVKSPSMNRAPSMNRGPSVLPGKSMTSQALSMRMGASPMSGLYSLMAPSAAAEVLLARDTSLRELSSKTNDPFPPLPPSCLDHHDPFASEDAVLSLAMASGSHKPQKSFFLPESSCPDGLDSEWWSKLVGYRANKVQCEAELGVLTRRMNLLFRDVTRLEAEEKKHSDLANERLAAVQAIRRERQLAVHDTTLQLKMKAGQVEVSPPSLVSSDMSAGRLLHRTVVEEINEAVRQRGDKKVEIMTAIKDFKKGIYQLEWEHKECDLLVEVLREKTKELQMLHVTRDLQSVFRNNGAPAPTTSTATRGGGVGLEGGPPSDFANLEALARQREVNQRKLLQERQRKLQKVNRLIEEKRLQNEEVSRHLVTLDKVLQEQERLRTSMQTMEDQNSRRMRSMVTLKKLKDISQAQKTELQLLTGDLDKMRLRTFPAFVDERGVSTLPPDTKKTLWQ